MTKESETVEIKSTPPSCVGKSSAVEEAEDNDRMLQAMRSVAERYPDKLNDWISAAKENPEVWKEGTCFGRLIEKDLPTTTIDIEWGGEDSFRRGIWVASGQDSSEDQSTINDYFDLIPEELYSEAVELAQKQPDAVWVTMEIISALRYQVEPPCECHRL